MPCRLVQAGGGGVMGVWWGRGSHPISALNSKVLIRLWLEDQAGPDGRDLCVAVWCHVDSLCAFNSAWKTSKQFSDRAARHSQQNGHPHSIYRSASHLHQPHYLLRTKSFPLINLSDLSFKRV